MIKIQNIYNGKRLIYLFQRDEKGNQIITKDNTFYPYYYERDDSGEYKTYDGFRAKKIICNEPAEIAKLRKQTSYEADILYPKRYIIDKIDGFEKCPIKYLFIDIEILTKDFPNPEEAKEPISCITVYNSFKQEYKTWFLGDYPNKVKDEPQMLEDFISYIKIETPDLLMGWNFLDFDYLYLSNRIEKFSERISPISRTRLGDRERNLFYPAGISIVDYMTLFKRVYMREQSYALDKIAQKYLKEESWKETEFDSLNQIVKEKNINDVKRLENIEKKLKIIELYDERRRFTTCLWEDLSHNSKVLDMYILREAKKRNIILPSKSGNYDERDDLEGAYRRADPGVYYNYWKADVGSMYPNQIINFCLDLQNIVEKETEDTINIDGLIVRQDSSALLPYIASNLIEMKDKLKGELKGLVPDSSRHEECKHKYDAVKALVNSLYGVTALPSFRLYNFSIASRITYLSRELLKYVEENLKEQGHDVCYTDTDSLFYKSDKDEIDFLNRLVYDWAIMKYNKPEINIRFESEGKFTKLLILGKCHYYGYIETKKGIHKEKKGMEMIRSSSSKFEAFFQEELVNKILDGFKREDVISWVETEKSRLKSLSLLEFSFPCKIANKTYKNEPIFVRAYNNTTLLYQDLKLNKGELFHYVFVKNLGRDEKGRDINVIAVNETMTLNIIRNYVDWDEVIRRNIREKVEGIFEALNWGSMNNQLSLF